MCSVEHIEQWRNKNADAAGRPYTIHEAARLGIMWWNEVVEFSRNHR